MDDFGVVVSLHAEKRLKERFGLNRKACHRHARRAFCEGTTPRDYPVKTVADYYTALQETDQTCIILIYKDIVHIFGLYMGRPSLITCYDPLSPGQERWHKTYIRGNITYKRRKAGDRRGTEHE